MASIITLSQAPEIIYDILKYLCNNDILSLQRTCRALYPTCYRHIWFALNLTEGIRPYSGRKIRYTDIEWIQRPGSFAGLDQILRFVQDCWINAPGLAYTKHITFGRFLTGSTDGTRSKLARILSQIFEDPRLSILSAGLKIDAHDLQLPNIPENTVPLLRLKNYSQSKSLDTFQISLQSKVIHSLVDLIDLEKVTVLTLAPGNWCNDPYRTRCWTAQDNSHEANIEETAQLLRSVPNLTYFDWNGYVEGYNLQLLRKISAAFAGMRRLQTLKIQREFFNRSFFLVPPDSVRKLELRCHVSSAWWNSFLTCPLTGVEELSIAPLRYKPGNFWAMTPKGLPEHLEPVSHIAVRGLKRFSLSLEGIPPGLEECLLHSNSALEEAIRTESLKRIESRIELGLA